MRAFRPSARPVTIAQAVAHHRDLSVDELEHLCRLYGDELLHKINRAWSIGFELGITESRAPPSTHSRALDSEIEAGMRHAVLLYRRIIVIDGGEDHGPAHVVECTLCGMISPDDHPELHGCAQPCVAAPA